MTTHEEFDSLAALDAIGAATSDEKQSLDAHLAGCDACRKAQDEYAEAATALARGLDPVEPPPEIRGAIMDAVLPVEIRRDNRWWLAVAATMFLALWGWRELSMRAAREKIKTRDAEIQTLSAQKTSLEQRNEKLNSEIAALAAGDTRMLQLTGQQVAPSASARVFLEPSKRRAVVLFANLPANPNDKSYQLWIIRSDQSKPESAGVFDASPNGIASITVQNLPVDTEIKGMAVTLEPRGGVTQPTNSNYYVAGKT